MREQDQIEIARKALDNRIEQADHPLMVLFYQPKREVVAGINDGDDPQDVIDVVDQKFRTEEIGLETFIQYQAARNAARWAQGELDSI